MTNFNLPAGNRHAAVPLSAPFFPSAFSEYANEREKPAAAFVSSDIEIRPFQAAATGSPAEKSFGPKRRDHAPNEKIDGGV
jgi:hypothetical protein